MAPNLSYLFFLDSNVLPLRILDDALRLPALCGLRPVQQIVDLRLGKLARGNAVRLVRYQSLFSE